MRKETFSHSAGGIDWHCERAGQGPTLVLVPSGEGDCSSFDVLRDHLAAHFSVLTFDMPGFSRSSAAQGEGAMAIAALSHHIAALVRSLGIDRASYYGCSSGGRAVLDLVIEYPDLVRNVIMHEVALPNPWIDANFAPMIEMPDEQIVGVCTHVYANILNEDAVAWQALGGDYHQRLSRNYITWVRNYLKQGVGTSPAPEKLRDQPITWTIGDLSPPEPMASNVELAQRAGIALGRLPCRHFPQVSIPDKLAAHIVAATQPHLA